jgi:hypothetical protein
MSNGLLHKFNSGGSNYALTNNIGSTNPSTDPIEEKLVMEGSPYSANNGQGVPVNPLATKQSTLHYDTKTNSEGYSVIGGKSTSLTTNNYSSYRDGTTNAIPLPTTLDPNDPTGGDPIYKLKYTSKNPYEKSTFQ